MASTAAAPAAINPKDFLGIDTLLSDEERDIRDTVRSFVRDRVLLAGDWFEEARFPTATETELGSSACSACTSRATGAQAPARPPTGSPAWSSRRATAAPHRSSRFRVAHDVCDLALGLAGAEAAWLPRWQPAKRSAASGSPSPTPAPTLPRCARARAAMDPTGSCTARRCGSRTARSPTSPWSGRQPKKASAAFSFRGHPWFHFAGHPPQALAARVGHQRAAARRGARPCRSDAAGGRLAAWAAFVSERGPLWHRLGRRRCRTRLPRGRARVQQGADRVRPPDRRDPDPAAQARDMALEVNRATLLALHLGRMKDDRPAVCPSTSGWPSSEMSTRPSRSPGQRAKSSEPTASPSSTPSSDT